MAWWGFFVVNVIFWAGALCGLTLVDSLEERLEASPSVWPFVARWPLTGLVRPLVWATRARLGSDGDGTAAARALEEDGFAEDRLEIPGAARRPLPSHCRIWSVETPN